MIDKGFNVVYAKSGGRPKSTHIEDKNGLIKFLVNKLDEIDFVSINDKQLNINEFLKGSLKLSRLVKLKNLYDI